MSPIVARLRNILENAVRGDDVEADLAQLLRDTAIHRAAVLLSTYVAGARGNPDEPHCAAIVKMWGQLAGEVDQEVEALGRLALEIPLPE